MAAHKITIDIFSAKSIAQAQAALKEYKDDLVSKCKTFVEELAKVGIQTAQGNLGAFEKYIVFHTEVDPEKYGCQAVMVATNNGLIKSEWYIDSSDNTKTADVSPILMAEFGSGLKADDSYGKRQQVPMGTGTFPEQTHAEDPDGWWYQTLDGVWHHSYGVSPTYPMMRASVAMTNRISMVAKQVFG
jgi:hypothetical protein